MTFEQATQYLHEHIPITRHLGVAVEAYDGQSVRLAAPLAPNLNHRSTAFGGSLSAVAILAGWTLVQLQLQSRGIVARLVIQRSEVDFDAPIPSDFVAIATLPAAPEWERFLETLARRGRARVRVRGTFGAAGRTDGRHEGVYVALLGPGPAA